MTVDRNLERERYRLGYHEPFYERSLQDAAQARENDRRQRRRQVVKAEDMAWEQSTHGLVKHIINEYMDYPCAAVDAYILDLPPRSSSGKHQHAAEEVGFVLEGNGYDLHWDPVVTVAREFSWELEETPARWRWRQGDFLYIPPMVAHQHFNPSHTEHVRLLLASNRLYKYMGYRHLVQHAPAPPPGQADFDQACHEPAQVRDDEMEAVHAPRG